ncbi:putative regulator of septum formation [Micromonospora sp. A202]|uniref:septum formation family protein n=1 Tax=Micromonospora sp. A202 TaxID=2572899 RepID=UPI00116764EE|nr:septum formation family protein [Micromonospora sp. A202]TQJ24370.1 putative regulator of septum formation [Micromonospora sp. A202]
MRRWWGPTVLLVLIMGTGGCDAILAEDSASFFAPEAGVCHATASDERSPEAYTPIPCSSKHETETFLVGRFGGADAAAEAPPVADSEGRGRVYKSCDAEADLFLGGEWRESRLAMRVLIPSAARWGAGERWYRCDLLEMHAADRWFPNPRANSLSGALTGDSPLRLSCFTEPEETSQGLVNLPPASCTGPHATEFAGIWRAGPDVEELTDEIVDAGCLSTIAGHVGLPEGTLGQRFEPLALVPEGEPEWQAGTLSVWCFLHSPQRVLNASVKGAGRTVLAAAR